MTEPTAVEMSLPAMSNSRSNSLKSSVRSTKRRPPRFAPPPAERRPLLIEDLYPHAFWLEKYNRMDAARRSTLTFADFSHQWCAGDRPLTWKFYSSADVMAVEKYAGGAVGQQLTEKYLHALSRGETDDPYATSSSSVWSLSSQV